MFSVLLRPASLFFIAIVALAAIAPIAGSADNVSVLGSRPRWQVLEKYQETITRDEFENLVRNVYCTHDFPPDMITIGHDSARILMNREGQKFFTLRFAADDKSQKRVPRLWRPAKELDPARGERPLTGLKIAIDPGHLGGKWAKMEERWFQVENSPPVQEGDLVLRVARILAPKLRKLGPEVSFVRH